MCAAISGQYPLGASCTLEQWGTHDKCLIVTGTSLPWHKAESILSWKKRRQSCTLTWGGQPSWPTSSWPYFFMAILLQRKALTLLCFKNNCYWETDGTTALAHTSPFGVTTLPFGPGAMKWRAWWVDGLPQREGAAVPSKRTYVEEKTVSQGRTWVLVFSSVERGHGED